MAMVLVGAMIVASIRTPWHGLVARQREGQIQHWSYEEAPIPFDRGQEMGQFELGSTVILLHTQQAAPWAKQWQAGSLLQMGAAMTTEASRANTEA
jgi:phosphatidylserine decarboxylase